jgi:hypothetical protein
MLQRNLFWLSCLRTHKIEETLCCSPHASQPGQVLSPAPHDFRGVFEHNIINMFYARAIARVFFIIICPTMNQPTSISLAKLPDRTYIFSLHPFDPKITGDMIAYPRVSLEQLQMLRDWTPEQVQKILASLTNL